MLLSEAQLTEFSLEPLKHSASKLSGKLAATFQKLKGVALNKVIQAAANYLTKKYKSNNDETISKLEKTLTTIERISPELGRRMEARFKQAVGGQTTNECFEMLNNEFYMNEGLLSAGEEGPSAVVDELMFGWMRDLADAASGNGELGKLLPSERAVKALSALVTLGLDVALCMAVVILIAFLQGGGDSAKEALSNIAEPVNTLIHFIKNLA